MSYEDILLLPHPESRKHPRMPMVDRAAQFAPFAALSGHGAMIQEAQRLTQSPVLLSDSAIEELDSVLRILQPGMTVAIHQFIPDQRKDGGSCIRQTGQVRKVDAHGQSLILTNSADIPFASIVSLEILG